MGVGYKIGSVSLGIPLGKISNGTLGIGVRATGKGYYKLALNKQVKPTIMLIQYRTKQMVNGQVGGSLAFIARSIKLLE